MAENTLRTRIKVRTDTYANWHQQNPILLDGEIAVVTLTDSETNIAITRFKIGDGTNQFDDLKWASDPDYDSDEEMLVF